MDFVDNDIRKKGMKFFGKTVKHPSEIVMFENKVLIASEWYREIKQQLEVDFGLMWEIDFFISPIFYSFNEMESENTQSSFLLKLKNDFNNYLKVFDLLDNEVSKALYYKVLKGRISYGAINLPFPLIPKVSYKQYFHSQVKPEDNDIIVDAGAYIGDTIEQITQEGVNYKKIYAFEPDEENFKKILQNTKTYQKIECIKSGLWGKSDKLFFYSNGTGVSAITHSKEISNSFIDVVGLDDFFKDKEPPTLIKMDIEGAEYEALLGAKEIITKHKPKLQICIYHKPEHLWQIPLFIKELVPEYKLYLGHHTNMLAETVLYAKV